MRAPKFEMANMHSMRTANKGFTLIEVLVAVLVLAVGILGAGALQTVGLQVTQGAANRSQAVILASDIVDRMLANRTVLNTYVGTDTSTVVPAAAPACLSAAGGCSPAQIAAADISAWATRMAVLPNGVGTIALLNGAYVVQVTWNENEWTGAARGSTPQSFLLTVSM